MSSPILKHFINLWTLQHYPNASEQGEWTFDQKLAAAKAAGFAGFQAWSIPELAELAQKYELTYLGACDANATTYQKRLTDFAAVKPLRINIQLCDHNTAPEEAVRVWIDLMQAAADLHLEIDLEVHRDTCTETPEKTWRIADLYQEQTGQPIRFNFDLSHFAIVKHLGPPYAARLLERPELIGLSGQMHLRPFNGHHCQIPVTNGQGQITEQAKYWFDFVEAIFKCWLQGKQDGETLWACPELGALTSGYWIPPFPDPWKDAIFARHEFEKIWQKVLVAPQ